MENFFKKERKSFCEGCNDLGLFDPELDGCIVCTSNAIVDELAHYKFSKAPNILYNKHIGFYLKCIDSVSERFSKKSSAGGLATSLIRELLDLGHIDYAVTVSFEEEEQAFVYKKINSISELSEQQRSAYYPVKLDRAFDIINKTDGRCLITGIPTAIKAIELKKKNNIEFAKKVKYTLGLVSGGIKISDYTDYMCRKAGKESGFNDLKYLSYRDKPVDDLYASNTYYFTAKTNEEIYQLKANKVKMNWPTGLLKSFASDFCDDTFNMASDITVMDGWLDKYKNSSGVSLAVVRNADISNVINISQDLQTNDITALDVIRSQAGGLRHKTSGLKARLKFYSMFGNQIPHTRISPKGFVHPIIFIEQILRLWTSYISRRIYTSNHNFKEVDYKLKPWKFFLRVVSKFKRLFIKKDNN